MDSDFEKLYAELPEITFRVDRLSRKKGKEIAEILRTDKYKTALVICRREYRRGRDELEGVMVITAYLEKITLYCILDKKLEEFTEHYVPIWD